MSRREVSEMQQRLAAVRNLSVDADLMAGSKDPYRSGVANGLRMALAVLQGVPFTPVDPLPVVTPADPVKEPVTSHNPPKPAPKAPEVKGKHKGR